MNDNQIIGNGQTLLTQAHFRHLNKEEIEDPFIYINEFCGRETAVHYFRQDILDLLKTAYSYEEKIYSDHSPNYGYDQQQLVKVMEAVYVLYAKGYTFSTKVGKVHTDRYHGLNFEEIVNITYFLKGLFDYKNLNEWREYLDDILIHAYKESSVGYFEYDNTPFLTIGLLEKLTEAVFVIHELAQYGQVGAPSSTPAEVGEPEDMDEKVDISPSGGEQTALTEGTDSYQGNHRPSACVASVTDRGLSERLSKEVHDFFSLIDPGFVGEGLRYIMLNYMRVGFETGFGKEAMLAELMYPLQRLFELFDVARCETSHWGNRRAGGDFVN